MNSVVTKTSLLEFQPCTCEEKLIRQTQEAPERGTRTVFQTGSVNKGRQCALAFARYRLVPSDGLQNQ